VSEPDVTKKKKRKRSARVYINVHKPVNPEAAALLADFPDDDDDAPTPAHTEARARTRAMAKPTTSKRHFTQAQRRRLAARNMALPDGSYPIETAEDLHNAAVLARTGHGDAEGARKLIRRRAKELGVPDPMESSQKAVSDLSPDMFTGHAGFDRVSPPLGAGHAAYGVGDHGAARGTTDPMNQPGPKALALGHPDMRQSTTRPQPLFSAPTEADMFPRDLHGMSNGIPVALSRLDAAAASGLTSAPGNPAARLMPHIAQGSANPPNGSHGLAAPACPPTAAMKNSDRLAIMKRHMFPGSGGSR
jgi:hypothetical protein